MFRAQQYVAMYEDHLHVVHEAIVTTILSWPQPAMSWQAPNPDATGTGAPRMMFVPIQPGRIISATESGVQGIGFRGHGV